MKIVEIKTIIYFNFLLTNFIMHGSNIIKNQKLLIVILINLFLIH